MLKSKIIQESGERAYNYLCDYIDFKGNDFVVLSTTTSFNFPINDYSSLVNLHRVNDIRYINKFFESVNIQLPDGGVFIGCVETFRLRANRIVSSRVPIYRNVYFFLDFILTRVFPKLPIFKKAYFAITGGQRRVISKAETLGRLVCCGFEIVDYKIINNLLYFVTKKVSAPNYDLNPSYGPLYTMPRIGKDEKIIGVYKLRTMHPYAEYLQDYILKVNGYADSGKPADDFRLTPWAKTIRKYWLDELPQLLNVLKGDLNLVGARPVSKRYFQDIPEDLQKLRLKYKPGCIPPYVALNRNGSVDSVLSAEREYLEEKGRKPYTTDIKYFFKAVFNIVFRNKRSA